MRLQVSSIWLTSAGSSPLANWFFNPQRFRYSSSHFALNVAILRFVGRHLAKDQLADWKNDEASVTHDADVKLTAFDVFLRDRVAGVFLVNKRHAIAKCFVALDE